MNSKKSRIRLMVLSIAVTTSGSFPSLAFAEDNSNVSMAAETTVESKSKINQFLEEKRVERAKELIESTPESSPLTIESKEEIIDHYADKYIPKKGCSLLELPPDSDINYVPPKPKEEPKPEPAPTTQSIQKTTSTQTPEEPTYSGKVISMSSEERTWLEKLIQAEAGGEPYEGKLAVATIIANRVESSSFPNTVMEVIKAGNEERHQFSPWDDGRIYNITPDNETKKAVVQVFDKGERNLPNETTYFAVKTVAFNDWMGQTRKYITTIGNHAFFSQHAK